ncbi:hypothetical protein [Ideonella sp. YS5]|uniref:hypothetical protein n=1 Tax=Ideonella sp. YS5 TaxID=3453714 RepID=UPI003EE9AF45
MALTTLARELATLEQERKTLSAELEAAKEKRLADANRAGSSDSRAELGKLQDRVRHAATALHEKTARRDALLDKLERAEQQLASCERSLQALSIDDAPREEAAVAPEAATSRPQPLAQPQVQPQAVAAPTRVHDPAETAARERVRDLTKELELAKAGQARARQALVEARNEVQRQQENAETMLLPERYAHHVYGAGEREVNEYLVAAGLPAMDDVGARGNDERFASYLAHFTEEADGGGVRLKDAFQDPDESATAFSALFGAMLPNAQSSGLVQHFTQGDMSPFTAALRIGHEALLPQARIAVVNHITEIAVNAERLAVLAQHGRAGRRRTGIGRNGPVINREQGLETGRRNAVLARILANPAQRINIISGLAEQFSSLLDGVTKAYRGALGRVDAAKEQLEQVKGEQRPAFQRAIDAERQLNEARDELKQLSADRRQREAAEARQAAQARQAAAASTSGTPVPEMAVASSTSTGTDTEARQLKLRGDVLKHTDTAEGLRTAIAEAGDGIRKAATDLRAAEDQLDTAAARHARDTENARRERGDQGEELTSLRTRLADLDARIGQARDALRADPARKSTISDRAWDRAVERHVEPDDASLRARARITGYSGAYPSQAELARSAADVYTHVSQQPRFQAVMAATSRAEFERAAAAVPGGVTDLVHEHGREVGRGFSNDPDQTARPTPLTQSNFSLQFVQGRVVVTHIYPYVPHRQLTTA